MYPRPQEIGLFLDVDGTLLDIAPHPEAVEVPADLIGALAAAERRLAGALALISGRPIAALDRLFAPLRLRASGVHGAEREAGGVRAKSRAACATLSTSSRCRRGCSGSPGSSDTNWNWRRAI
jgi:trehalose 6-phosphate phosphatase